MAHNFRTKEETARHNRRLRRQALGVVLSVLVVVGLVTVVAASSRAVAAPVSYTHLTLPTKA